MIQFLLDLLSSRCPEKSAVHFTKLTLMGVDWRELKISFILKVRDG